MFAIARQALVDMAQYIPGYQPSAHNPDKFCHGYGIFQYDLQFFLEDPDFFLNRDWTRFDTCMEKFLKEINRALRVVGLQNATSLTDLQMAYVAIAYNTGSFHPDRGLKQGHKSDGKYYGENIADFIQLSKSAPWTGSGAAPQPEPADVGQPGAMDPTPGMGIAERYRVVARHGLRLRQGPGTEFPAMRTIAFGTTLDVLRKDGGWSLVDLEGDSRADGHMLTAFLERA